MLLVLTGNKESRSSVLHNIFLSVALDHRDSSFKHTRTRGQPVSQLQIHCVLYYTLILLPSYQHNGL